MINRYLIYFFLTTFFITSCSNKSSDQSEVLFVENAEDWVTGGDATWSFEGNELVGRLDSGSGFVMTKKVFKDFELSLEFKPDSTINSGVFVRCQDKQLSADKCYELNIWDLHPNQDYRTGTIVRRSPKAPKVETLNKWNTYQIKVTGNRLIARINGIVTAEIENNELTQGFIGLQAAASGEIRFRNVKALPLGTR